MERLGPWVEQAEGPDRHGFASIAARNRSGTSNIEPNGTAPAAASSAALSPLGLKPRQVIPAASAPRTPAIESSITRHAAGDTPSDAAASRNTSGAGLPAPPRAIAS